MKTGQVIDVIHELVPGGGHTSAANAIDRPPANEVSSDSRRDDDERA